MITKNDLSAELKNLDCATKKLSITHLRLAVESEKRKHTDSKLKYFECYVINFNDLKEFLNHHLKSNPDTCKKFQVIVEIDAHYLTIDISWGLLKQCLLLDSANDTRMMRVYFLLNSFSFDQIFVASGKIDKEGRSNNLQKDFYSCAIFALDHAIQLSKINIYDKLEETIGKDNAKTISIHWGQLPIQLIWNAQSIQFLNSYLKENKDQLSQCEIETFNSYIQENIIEFEGKRRNIAIDNIFESTKKEIILFVESLKQAEISFIIEKKTSFFPFNKNKAIDSMSTSSLPVATEFEATEHHTLSRFQKS